MLHYYFLLAAFDEKSVAFKRNCKICDDINGKLLINFCRVPFKNLDSSSVPKMVFCKTNTAVPSADIRIAIIFTSCCWQTIKKGTISTRFHKFHIESLSLPKCSLLLFALFLRTDYELSYCVQETGLVEFLWCLLKSHLYKYLIKYRNTYFLQKVNLHCIVSKHRQAYSDNATIVASLKR